jgi:very-short-patch-repair endonuclease
MLAKITSIYNYNNYMYNLPNNKNNVEYKRELRTNNTLPEKIVWYNILNKNKTGYTFTRQYLVGNYILDFYCRKLGLNIELDGKTHDFTYEDDKIRDEYLTSLGIKILRIGNYDVLYNLDGVYNYIRIYIANIDNPS